MLDFSQFNQLANLSDLKSRQSLKIIVLPEDLKRRISYKALLSEATWSDLGDIVSSMHFFKDQSAYFNSFDDFDMIKSDERHNVVVVDYDEEDREEFIITFEDEKALENFLKPEWSKWRIDSDSAYIELDDQMLQEIESRTREDQIEFCDRKIAKAKRDMKLAAATVKDFEDLKGELMND